MNVVSSLSDQSMRYGTVRLSVPPGFQNLIRLISHEVLREQPKDNVKFIADFLQDVLAIRESTGYDPVLQGDLIERVQAQYAQIKQERGGEPRKRPQSPDGAASGDHDQAAKRRESKERVQTMIEGVMEDLVESTNQEAEAIQGVEPSDPTEAEAEAAPPTEEEEQPSTTGEPEVPAEVMEEPSEDTGAPDESGEAPAVDTEAPAEDTEAPAVDTEAPPEGTEAPAETQEYPTDTQESAV